MFSWLILYIYIYMWVFNYFQNNTGNNKYYVSNLQVRKKKIYEVFKNYLIYIRNNVKHIYYFVNKKQKKIVVEVFKKYLLYIFYKFEKINWWCLICKLEQTKNINILWGV